MLKQRTKKKTIDTYPYQNPDLIDLPGEKWDDIPSLDGAYHLSSYGRVKSLKRFVNRPNGKGFWLREKILAPGIRYQTLSGGTRKLYRLTTAVSFEGKRDSRS